MKIPAKLKIGAHTYKVQFVGELDKCGATNRDNGTISIAKEMAQSHKEVTLLHEILHALNSELDHTVLDSLAEQLYQVLSDNKMFK